MGSHPVNCGCDTCTRVRANVAAELLDVPIEHRRTLALEAVVKSLPPLKVCPDCGGAAVRPIGPLSTMGCTGCGARGLVYSTEKASG